MAFIFKWGTANGCRGYMCISTHSTKTFYFFFRKLYQCPSRKLVNQSARWTIAAEYFKVPPHGRGEIGAIFTTNQLLRHFCWHSNPFSHVPDGCRHFKFNRIGFDGLLARFFWLEEKFESFWRARVGGGPWSERWTLMRPTFYCRNNPHATFVHGQPTVFFGIFIYSLVGLDSVNLRVQEEK